MENTITLLDMNKLLEVIKEINDSMSDVDDEDITFELIDFDQLFSVTDDLCDKDPSYDNCKQLIDELFKINNRDFSSLIYVKENVDFAEVLRYYQSLYKYEKVIMRIFAMTDSAKLTALPIYYKFINEIDIEYSLGEIITVIENITREILTNADMFIATVEKHKYGNEEIDYQIKLMKNTVININNQALDTVLVLKNLMDKGGSNNV